MPAYYIKWSVVITWSLIYLCDYGETLLLLRVKLLGTIRTPTPRRTKGKVFKDTNLLIDLCFNQYNKYVQQMVES